MFVIDACRAEGRREGRRETGNIGGGKCALGKGMYIVHCMKLNHEQFITISQ